MNKFRKLPDGKYVVLGPATDVKLGIVDVTKKSGEVTQATVVARSKSFMVKTDAGEVPYVYGFLYSTGARPEKPKPSPQSDLGLAAEAAAESKPQILPLQTRLTCLDCADLLLPGEKVRCKSCTVAKTPNPRGYKCAHCREADGLYLAADSTGVVDYVCTECVKLTRTCRNYF